MYENIAQARLERIRKQNEPINITLAFYIPSVKIGKKAIKRNM